MEAASLRNIKEEHKLDQETIQQWVCDVRQWAVTGKTCKVHYVYTVCVYIHTHTHTSVNDCTFIQIIKGVYILKMSLIVSLVQLFCFTYLERVYTAGCTEELRADIENITVTLLRKKQDLYRQHGLLSNQVI